MNKLLTSFFALVIGCLLLATNATAQEHDQRIKDLLDGTSMKYKVDEDGDFRLLYEYGDGRSQLVFINSATEKYEGMEMREIWAVGYMPPEEGDKVEAKISDNLIRANSRSKMGGWLVKKMEDKEVGVFRATVPADASEEIILRTMKFVGITADEKEAELLGSDEL